jgi:heterodisulfide reductase subunit D
MGETNGDLFLEALHGRVEETLSACVGCGKCVEACPMVEPAGIASTPPHPPSPRKRGEGR